MIRNMKEIQKVDKKRASEIIETFKPFGKFYLEENGVFVGIDNSTGDCFVEVFKDEKTCLKWLNNESLIYHTQLDFEKPLDELKKENTNNSNAQSYEVIVTEELVTSIIVNAVSEEEAIRIVANKYDKGEIILNINDFNYVNFKATLA